MRPQRHPVGAEAPATSAALRDFGVPVKWRWRWRWQPLRPESASRPPPAQAARWAERRAQSGDLGAGPRCAGAREGSGARASSRARGLLEDTARAEGVRDKLGSWRGLMVGPLGDRGREGRPFEVMGRKSL